MVFFHQNSARGPAQSQLFRIAVPFRHCVIVAIARRTFFKVRLLLFPAYPDACRGRYAENRSSPSAIATAFSNVFVFGKRNIIFLSTQPRTQCLNKCAHTGVHDRRRRSRTLIAETTPPPLSPPPSHRRKNTFFYFSPEVQRIR